MEREWFGGINIRFSHKDREARDAILKGIQEYITGHHGIITNCQTYVWDRAKRDGADTSEDAK